MRPLLIGLLAASCTTAAWAGDWYVDDDGEAQKMELPITTADWAATEGRFKKHFKRIKPEDWNDDHVPFHEFLDLSDDERLGRTPFIWVIDGDKKLGRLACSMEMVQLAEDRRHGLVAAGGVLFGTGLLVAATLPLGELAIETLDDGVVVFDANARLARCNRRYRELYAPASRRWRRGSRAMGLRWTRSPPPMSPVTSPVARTTAL